jgi:hypothetical protein
MILNEIYDECNKVIKKGMTPKTVFVDTQGFDELTKFLEDKVKKELQTEAYLISFPFGPAFVRKVNCPFRLIEVSI